MKEREFLDQLNLVATTALGVVATLTGNPALQIATFFPAVAQTVFERLSKKDDITSDDINRELVTLLHEACVSTQKSLAQGNEERTAFFQCANARIENNQNITNISELINVIQSDLEIEKKAQAASLTTRETKDIGKLFINFFITQLYKYPALEKHLFTTSLFDHEERIAALEDATGSTTCEVLPSESHCSLIPKEFLNITPYAGRKYISRPEILEKLEIEVAKNKITFISGISGCGKSELSKKFACLSRFSYVVPLELEIEESNTYESLLNSPKFQITGNYEPSEIIRRKADLLALAEDTVLIIVDNYDNPNDQNVIERLISSTGKAKILVTTQLGQDGLSNYGGVLSLPQDQVEHCCRIFAVYAEQDVARDPIVSDIVRLIGCHELTSALLGILIKNYDGKPDDILKDMRISLREALQKDLAIEIRKDGKVLRGSPYDILKCTFKNILRWNFAEMERQVLGAMILSPTYYHNISTIAELVGDLPDWSKNCKRARDAINKLTSRGVIQKGESDLQLHPLIRKLVTDKSCGEGGKKAIADMSLGLGFHLLNNEMVSDTIKAITYPDLQMFLARKFAKKNFDWQQVGYRNRGWLLYFYMNTISFVDFHEGIVPNIASLLAGIAYNHQSLFEENLTSETLLNETVNVIYPDNVCPVYPKHKSLLITARGPEGHANFLYNTTLKQAWCIHNLSQQKSPKFRYYRTTTYSEKQRGTLTHAVFEGIAFNSSPKILHIPDSIYGIQVTEMLPKVLMGNTGVHEVKIPNTIKVIPQQAFFDASSLKRIFLPESLSRIEAGSFMDSPIEKITFPQNIEFIAPGAISEGEYSFTVEIPEGINAGIYLESESHNTNAIVRIGEELVLNQDGYLVLSKDAEMRFGFFGEKYLLLSPFMCKVKIIPKK